MSVSRSRKSRAYGAIASFQVAVLLIMPAADTLRATAPSPATGGVAESQPSTAEMARRLRDAELLFTSTAMVTDPTASSEMDVRLGFVAGRGTGVQEFAEERGNRIGFHR